jgi:prepilin-type N-terminal cleavage/methylation domain-containing protein/prepilin-type processing-associated H-X9-DG protein
MKKMQSRQTLRRGFTLVELLVVIGIIAVLATLLVPAVGNAQTTGQNAVCKGNLRQIGLALSLYAADYQQYPVFVEFNKNPIVGWDNKLCSYTKKVAGVFNCPANSGLPRWTNGIPRTGRPNGGPNQSYGYNLSGCAAYESSQSNLGLGGTVHDSFGLVPLNMPSGLASESKVCAPSDMIAISDYKPGSDADMDYDPINLLADFKTTRHNLGANVVFCDVHVEYNQQKTWLEKSEARRSRWNIDNQPHRELWSNNPQ